jgi:hypothetical protein
MANPLAEAAVEAIELDAFSKDIPDLIPMDDTLYGFFKNNATIIPVSNVTAAGGVTRPSFRVPMRIQAGAAINQGTGNADSLGRGTGSQWAAFALSPVFFYNTCEITFLARISTEGQKRGLFNVQAQELKNTFQQATQGLESLIQGDGSGTLDQIPSTATINNNTGSGQSTSSIVGLNNAFQFQDQQTVQVFPSIGGTSRGSFTVSYTDPVTNTIYSAGALPTGTTTGDYLVVNGSSGAAGSSILGLRAWQVNSNTGTIGGLSRSAYPSRLSTPTINLNGASLSLTTGLSSLTLLGRALGQENMAVKKAIWYCGPDQAMQVAQLYFNSIFSETSRASGDTAPDIAKKYWPAQFAGRDLHVGWNALPGRLDLFTPDTWYMGELLPLELYDFGGGITVAPVPDIVNGGYLTSSMFSYVAALNMANSNPRAGVIIQNAAQATLV